jgi:hypothetical protein
MLDLMRTSALRTVPRPRTPGRLVSSRPVLYMLVGPFLARDAFLSTLPQSWRFWVSMVHNICFYTLEPVGNKRKDGRRVIAVGEPIS